MFDAIDIFCSEILPQKKWEFAFFRVDYANNFGVSEFTRAYFCNDEIYKCLDNAKKDLDVKDDWVSDLQMSLLEDFARALKMEGKAE